MAFELPSHLITRSVVILSANHLSDQLRFKLRTKTSACQHILFLSSNIKQNLEEDVLVARECRPVEDCFLVFWAQDGKLQQNEEPQSLSGKQQLTARC